MSEMPAMPEIPPMPAMPTIPSIADELTDDAEDEMEPESGIGNLEDIWNQPFPGLNPLAGSTERQSRLYSDFAIQQAGFATPSRGLARRAEPAQTGAAPYPVIVNGSGVGLASGQVMTSQDLSDRINRTRVRTQALAQRMRDASSRSTETAQRSAPMSQVYSFVPINQAPQQQPMHLQIPPRERRRSQELEARQWHVDQLSMAEHQRVISDLTAIRQAQNAARLQPSIRPQPTNARSPQGGYVEVYVDPNLRRGSARAPQASVDQSTPRAPRATQSTRRRIRQDLEDRAMEQASAELEEQDGPFDASMDGAW
jgi:hypothetical protein